MAVVRVVWMMGPLSCPWVDVPPANSGCMIGGPLMGMPLVRWSTCRSRRSLCRFHQRSGFASSGLPGFVLEVSPWSQGNLDGHRDDAGSAFFEMVTRSEYGEQGLLSV